MGTVSQALKCGGENGGQDGVSMIGARRGSGWNSLMARINDLDQGHRVPL